MSKAGSIPSLLSTRSQHVGVHGCVAGRSRIGVGPSPSARPDRLQHRHGSDRNAV